MHRESESTTIKCDACGVSCKSPEIEIFEYVTMQNVNRQSKHFCLDCAKKIDDYIDSISLSIEFNL